MTPAHEMSGTVRILMLQPVALRRLTINPEPTRSHVSLSLSDYGTIRYS